MILALNDIPERERIILMERYLNRWQGTIPATDFDKAKDYAQEGFVYMLRMFWQARYDKMDGDSKALFDWLSSNMLSEDVEYKGTKRAQLIINHDDHHRLAREVFENLWKHYAASPESGLILAERQTLTGRIFGLFNR
jgi:hypothetical protein